MPEVSVCVDPGIANDSSGNEQTVWTDKVISESTTSARTRIPHSNGFADGGDSVVLAQTDTRQGRKFVECDLRQVRASIRRFAGTTSWVDVARGRKCDDGEEEAGVWLLDLIGRVRRKWCCAMRRGSLLVDAQHQQ